jgi:signal transduction histidine kinase
MEAIGTIASGVAHNFRNTLAGISANNQVIQLNYKEDPRLNSITTRINSSIEKSIRLVEDLMQISRRQLEVTFNKVNLAEVIKEIYQIIMTSFAPDIDIQTKVSPELFVKGNYLGLSQVIMNLCTNARDAMPEGGKLLIEVGQKGEKAVVSVSDTGMGMEKTTLEQCFNPFFTTKDVGKGTGLGLSTSYGIIKNHEGEIHVDSQPNNGTVFKICLPLDTSES